MRWLLLKIFFQYVIIFAASIALGWAFNVFLLPHEVLTGGVTGIAMILGLMTPINTGIWIVLLNIPILIVGWMKLGKVFIANSLFSVLVTSIAMIYIPVQSLTDDALLSSVFGGVISGIAIGLIIRYYGSTGGFDIISLLLTRKRDIPIGGLIFVLNSVVVFLSGFIFSWELAMYTMASIYITGVVIDRIHTKHMKLSLMVITSREEEIKKELLGRLLRGITVMEGEGAFSKAKRKILFTVITKYELAFVKDIIKKVDPDAFVTVNQTLEIMGNFRR